MACVVSWCLMSGLRAYVRRRLVRPTMNGGRAALRTVTFNKPYSLAKVRWISTALPFHSYLCDRMCVRLCLHTQAAVSNARALIGN